MKTIVALDSFKGCMTSLEAGKAVCGAVNAVYPAGTVEMFEVADGGEGSAECLLKPQGGSRIEADTLDPLDRPIKAAYFIDPCGSEAAIDVAAASGLALLSPQERDPLAASTFGTGLLIRHAAERGCRHIILCVGGTATVDGGLNLLKAMGAVTSSAGAIDISAMRRNYTGIRFTVLTDVTTPLLGPRGAAAVFGPQKGADTTTVPVLEDRLGRLARNLARAGCPDVSHLPAGGAGGGVAAAMAAVFGARLRPGAAYILDRIGFNDSLAGADIVITGEGRIDSQTLMGKLPFEIMLRAKARSIPTIAMAGAVENRPELYRAGFLGAVCIQKEAAGPQKALKKEYAIKNLRNATADALRLFTFQNQKSQKTP